MVYFYFNNSNNPYITLAFEEFMLHKLTASDIMLYLYIHSPGVIIGRNQNAWKEVDICALNKDNVLLARRISGGGAVYHDSGNLNFSFIAGKEIYDVKRQLGVIVNSLADFGVNAYFSGRNDILAHERKFSGNAFCHKKDASYHHGTILINTDINRLSRYLNVSPDKIKSKGIDSVRSRVINLCEINPCINTNNMADSLINSFIKEYGKFKEYILNEEAQEEINKIADRNKDFNWIYGNSPKCEITLSNRFEWGEIEICLNVSKGIISEAFVYSDAMEIEFCPLIAQALKDTVYKKEETALKIDSIYKANSNILNRQKADDIISMLDC